MNVPSLPLPEVCILSWILSFQWVFSRFPRLIPLWIMREKTHWKLKKKIPLSFPSPNILVDNERFLPSSTISRFFTLTQYYGHAHTPSVHSRVFSCQLGRLLEGCAMAGMADHLMSYVTSSYVICHIISCHMSHHPPQKRSLHSIKARYGDEVPDNVGHADRVLSVCLSVLSVCLSVSLSVSVCIWWGARRCRPRRSGSIAREHILQLENTFYS